MVEPTTGAIRPASGGVKRPAVATTPPGGT